MSEKRPSHCALLLELLSDGAWHSHLEIYALHIVGHSRVAELRGRRYGYVIEQRRRKVGSGDTEYRYRLVAAPAENATPLLPRLEAQLSPGARARLTTLRVSTANDLPEALAPPAEYPSDPQKASKAEEAGPVTDGGSRDAQGGPATQGPQLDLDELVAVENELAALRSLGGLTPEDLDRLDELAARHEQMTGAAA